MQVIRNQIDKKNNKKAIAYPLVIISMPAREGTNMVKADITKSIRKITAVFLALFFGFGIIFLIISDSLILYVTAK